MSEEYYRRMLAENPNDHDYAALEQGPESTTRRHSQVAKYLKPAGSYLLDLGCGTGLLLEHLVTHATAPSRYVGVDFLPEREDALMARADRLHAAASFEAADVRVYMDHYLAQGRPKFDLVVAPGLVGFEPFSSITALFELIDQMQAIGHTGLVTIPIPYKDFLGCPHQFHFPLDDLEEMRANRDFHKPVMSFGYSEREAVLWWI